MEQSTDYRITKYGADTEEIEVLILNKPMDDVLAGMISSPLFQENIALALDTNSGFDYDFSCLGVMANGSKPRIYMTPELITNLQIGTSEAKTILFHELGHYVHKDFLISNVDRASLVESNAVAEKELAADSFAVKYLGMQTVIEGLQQLLLRVKTTYDGTHDRHSFELSIKELELRIAYQASKTSK